jgi:hypothetical protein
MMADTLFCAIVMSKMCSANVEVPFQVSRLRRLVIKFAYGAWFRHQLPNSSLNFGELVHISGYGCATVEQVTALLNNKAAVGIRLPTTLARDEWSLQHPPCTPTPHCNDTLLA